MNELSDPEDLITGFFSAVFQYFSTQFGEIQSIKTKNNIILIKKIENAYVSIVIRTIDYSKVEFSEKIWFLNKRLEEIGETMLRSIERNLVAHLRRLRLNGEEACLSSPVINEIERDFEEIVEITKNKMIKVWMLKDSEQNLKEISLENPNFLEKVATSTNIREKNKKINVYSNNL
ncbi:MAG: hypothetical protein ACTSRZ_18965 [Promethearchaeota archaeon]